VESANRKLIRPSFNDMKEKTDAPPRKGAGAPQKRPVPPDQTNAENFYYVKQMQSKTPMVITLKDGEVLKGVIEWYDRSCLKLNRDGAPNLLLYKGNIKYMFKDEDA
jgi:sRNA-binding regulator protein Hfq